MTTQLEDARTKLVVGHEQSIVDAYTIDTLGAPFTVVLKNCVSVWLDPKTGDEKVHVPDLVGLTSEVVRCRTLDPRKLCGEEIRFLRKGIGLQSGKLATVLGITPEHYSRYESNSRVMSEAVEKWFRVFAYRSTLLNDAERLADKCVERINASSDCAKKVNRRKRKRAAKRAGSEKAAAELIDTFVNMRIASVFDATTKPEYRFVRAPVSVPSNDEDCDDGNWEMCENQPVAACG